MRKRGILFSIISLAGIVFAFSGSFACAGEAYFLAIKGDGTASVVLDKEAGVAWITDGGRSGAQGITGASIDQKPVLEFLEKSGVTKLFITCSHPHEDHMGGLKDLVQSAAIRRFANVTFVESYVPENDSLFTLFKRAHGDDFTKTHATSKSATNTNAFSKSESDRATVIASNFNYRANPNKPGVTPDPHGRSIIMQYQLRGIPPQTVVDFDDSSTELINKWVARKSKATIIIHAHHGSKNNSIDLALANAKSIGLVDVIITVNRTNRYKHPDPDTLLKLVTKLGPEHVFLTDSDIGENVRIQNAGVSDAKSPDAHLARLKAFVTAQIERREALLIELYDQISMVPPKTVPTSSKTSRKWDEDIALFVATGRLSTDDATAIQRNKNAIKTYEKVVARLDKSRDDYSILAGIARSPDTDLPPPGMSPQPQPKTPSGGTKAWQDQVSRNEASLTPEEITKYGEEAGYYHETHKKAPTWGGIVFGNRAISPPGSRATSVWIEQAEDFSELSSPQPVIRVQFADGKMAYFNDINGPELWSAYNFVQPTNELKSRYSQHWGGNKVGLIGVTQKHGVAINPAVAGTRLGWDGLFTDSVRETAQAISGSLPIEFAGIDWVEFNKSWMQWSDAPMAVTIEYGEINIEPLTPSTSCALRLRIATPPTEAAQAAERRLIEKEVAAVKQNTFLIDGHLSALDKTRIKRDAIEAYQRVYDDDSQWVSKEYDSAKLEKLCTGVPEVARISRLARAVGILNWVRSSTGKPLPDLPGWVKPIWVQTPEALNGASAAWGKRFSQKVTPIEIHKIRPTKSASPTVH